jgi:hypothetical protein
MSRKTIVMIVSIGMVAAVLLLSTGLRIFSKNQSQGTLQDALDRYTLKERARGKRGMAFYEVTLHLDQRRGQMGESEIIGYLGTPDLVGSVPSSPDRLLIYFYDRDGDRDWIACANLAENGLRYFSYIERDSMKRLGFRTTAPTSQ